MLNDSLVGVTQVIQVTKPALPSWLYLVVVLASLGIMSLCLILFCKCLVRSRRKKYSDHSTMCSRPKDPRLTGVLAEHPIQFVVPSKTVVDTTCTEDSDSDVVFRSSMITSLQEEKKLRKRSSLVNFYINPEELERAHYQETVQEVPKRKSLLAGLGRVGFSLNYNVARQQLCVRLIGARQLPSSLAKDSANPFAKVALLPDKTPKFLSKIQRHTTNPSFNENFVFVIKKESLDEKELKISVLDYDRFSRKLLIGFIRFPLKDAGINSNVNEDVTTGEIWTDLRLELEAEKQGQGELLFSLCYNPENYSLVVSILKARSLENEDRVSLLYVKVSLYVRKRLVRTKKTLSKKFCIEPQFGDTFPVHVSVSCLPDVDLVVTLCGKGGRTGKRVLGRCQVGANCPSEQGTQHWQDMLSSMKSTAAQWHSFAG